MDAHPSLAVAGYAPGGSSRERLVRDVVEAVAWHQGAEPIIITDPEALREGPGGNRRGVLLLLEASDALREALTGGWLVLSSRRHLDARHGQELYWVASERPAVLQRALLDITRQSPHQGVQRAAAQTVGHSLSPDHFARRWAPPLVSVVMPTFDDENDLSRSIQSVLDQSVSDLELIIVDDGSTDASRTRTLAFDDARIIRRWQSGGGPSQARNAGLEMARSRTLLSFLDSDDRWEPTFIERMIETMAVAPPTVGLAYCDYSLSIDGGPATRTVVEDPTVPTMAAGDGLLPIGSFVVRPEVLTHVGRFDENLYRGEDYEWLLRVGAHVEFIRVPELLFHYCRRGSGQLMSTSLDSARLQRSRLEALRRWSERIQAENRDP